MPPSPPPPRWHDRRPPPTSLLIAAGICVAITAICIAWLDAPLARWVGGHDTHLAIWNRGIDAIEVVLGFWISNLAAAVFVVGGMIATAAVARWRRHAPAWMFVAATHLIARIAMGWLKVATARLRPYEWLPHAAVRGDATFWHAGGVSFPSGHVVIVASLIVPLAIVAPRVGRPLLPVIAFVAIARMAVLAHFASDVVGAVALVAIVAWACAAAIRPLT